MKYRKRPVVIEAKQVLAIMSDGEVVFDDSTAELFPMDHEGVHVVTLEGNMYFGKGDWLIVGVRGERYPCKADIFAITYDLVAP